MLITVPKAADAEPPVPDRGSVERRVAITPSAAARLIQLGYRVGVEAGAGELAGFLDSAYRVEQVEIITQAEAWAGDLVLAVRQPSLEQVQRVRTGAILIAPLSPATSPELLQQLAAREITALALDAVPRISRAQAVDVLSSMANLAGYRAVIEAASEYAGLFTGQVTAAGKVPPARVFVVGAGVAGLAAIGTAVNLGAEVVAFDVRPEVAEQVRSLGAQFAQLPGSSAAALGRSDGYASELTGDAEAAARQLYDEQARAADIVITTALIPGRRAPVLLTAETLVKLRPGSVIVDLAAATGGNVEGTRAGERVVTAGGVTILGWTDLAGRLPRQASQLWGANLVNLVRLLTPRQDGVAEVDTDDQVVRAMLVAHRGEVTWPPPPVAVSQNPAPIARAEARPLTKPEAQRSGRTSGAILGLAAVLFGLIAVSAPTLIVPLTILALAIVVGFYVVSAVTPALHTPLMSVTNAISGIICVGAILQVGSASPIITAVSVAGIVVAGINIFGGFVVTQRMLGMFRRN